MGLSDTLSASALRWEANPQPATEEQSLDQVRALDRFLTSVEKRAFRIARIAVRDDDDALDIVQDAMLQLARCYGQRPSEEWKPLFYRILQNRIRDSHRRRKVRSRILGWLPGAFGASGSSADNDQLDDPYSSTADLRPQPAEQVMADQALGVLERALALLPARQQEAFLLRNLEDLDVAATAAAMGCSEGSVKTHYSRAVHSLRDQLGEAW
jgi:RNA polymerase sigma-70 factor (ECF subfamily)